MIILEQAKKAEKKLKCVTEILCFAVDVVCCLEHPVLWMEIMSDLNAWICNRCGLRK